MADEAGELPILEELRGRVLLALVPYVEDAAKLLGESLKGNLGRGQVARLSSARYILDAFKGQGPQRVEVSGRLDLATLVLRSMEPEAAELPPAVELHQVEALPAAEVERPQLVVAKPPTIRRKAGGEP